jgi:hypothetical protein
MFRSLLYDHPQTVHSSDWDSSQPDIPQTGTLGTQTHTDNIQPHTE